MIKEVYHIVENKNAVTVLVVLRDGVTKLVVKALPAARVVDACRQVRLCSVLCTAVRLVLVNKL